MIDGETIAAIIGLSGLVGIFIRVGMDRKAIDLRIEQAERKAKHDAVGAVQDIVAKIDDRKLEHDVFSEHKESVERRLQVLERHAGLNGHQK